MNLSPDDIVYWKYGFIELNATIVMTWIVMLFMAVGAYLITRNFKSDTTITRWQSMVEIIITTIMHQMEGIGMKKTRRYISFIGSLFLFIAFANMFTLFPGYQPPTGSLSTTASFALCVFVAVPFYGISRRGFVDYIKNYLRPSPVMLPFNILNELSRTLALAIRLFGNMMSGTIIISILLSIMPLLFPVVMRLLGLLTGMVQAYIFAILATVYITAAITTQSETEIKIKE